MDTAEIDKQVNVIEIGPVGALTEFLAENAAGNVAFEIDDRLVPILADTLRDDLTMCGCNKTSSRPDLSQLHRKSLSEPSIKVVANLPYYITTPILMHLIESDSFQEFVVMMHAKRWQTASRLSPTPRLMVLYPLQSNTI